MERTGVKRPRSTTPTKGVKSASDPGNSAPPPKKKNKDKSRKKKAKANREGRQSAVANEDDNNKSPSAPSTSHESAALQQQQLQQHPRTASPNGQRMSQILSTFSSVEHSRWEAYRRVVFPGDAIEQYVAFLLREHMVRRRHHPHHHGTPATTTTALQLRDLVAPQQAHEIGLVVSTLAKAYAQRLVTAAIAEQQCMPRDNNNNSNNNNNNTDALAPEHFLKAYESRQAQGLDPGFFLQARQDYQIITSRSSSTTALAAMAMGVSGDDDIQRLAALAAQDEYDKHQQQQQQQQQQPSNQQPAQGQQQLL